MSRSMRALERSRSIRSANAPPTVGRLRRVYGPAVDGAESKRARRHARVDRELSEENGLTYSRQGCSSSSRVLTRPGAESINACRSQIGAVLARARKTRLLDGSAIGELDRFRERPRGMSDNRMNRRKSL